MFRTQRTHSGCICTQVGCKHTVDRLASQGGYMTDEQAIRADPRRTFEERIIPGVRAALKRGAEKHGGLWWDQMTGDILYDAEHTIERHVKCELARALQALDYGDRDGYEHRLYSAIGYIAVALTKLHPFD
jgi:hypothetical protein